MRTVTRHQMLGRCDPAQHRRTRTHPTYATPILEHREYTPGPPPPPILVIRTCANPLATKENGETGFPISPLRTHLQRVFVALAAGRGWPQSLAGPRVAGELRDPRPLPPSSGHVRSMRMDRSHRTPAPVSRQQSPLERGCGASTKTISRDTPEVHQQLSPPRETLRLLSPPAVLSPFSEQQRTSWEELSASPGKPSSARFHRLRWIGGITRIESPTPQGRVARAPATR